MAGSGNLELEKGTSPSDEPGLEDIEKNDKHDSEDVSPTSDRSSDFSERHMEGAPSLRSRSGNDLSLTTSRQMQRVNTTASNALSKIRSRNPRKQFTHPLGQEKTLPDHIVDFEGPDDPYRPINWPFRKKVATTALYGLTTMGATLSSSIYSTATQQIAEQFNVGTEVSTLGTALFLFGMGLGPLLWAPLSELYGRKPVVLTPAFIGGIFAFGAGAGKDIQTIIICRFFQGVFGSAPVTNTGGVLGDIWSAEQRAAAVVGYALTLVGGPTLGPLIGSAIVTSYLRWRWTQYISGIFIMFIIVLDVLLLDESYPQALLVRKAQRLRHETGNWALHSKHEEWDPSLSEMAHKYLVRPFKILGTPIGALVAIYSSFAYGILFATLGAYPVAFEEVRGWSPVVGSLAFVGTLVGVFFGAAVNLLNQRFYLKRVRANNGKPVPEARLPPMMFGGISFAAGMFIFAWTSRPDIPWIAPMIGVVMSGAGFFTIFQAALNYLIDTFQRYAASAVAANTFLRSVSAGSFPLFIVQMLHAMGVDWGISVWAFFATAMIPIPFLFYIYGYRIRARGEWSRESTL
jgi:MFS family permease